MSEISANVRVVRASASDASHDRGPTGWAASIASWIQRRPSTLKPRDAQNSLAVTASSRARCGFARS